MIQSSLSIVREVSPPAGINWQPDCACSTSRVAVSRDETDEPESSWVRLDPVLMAELNADYWIVHSPYSTSGSLLLSREVIDALQDDPRRLPDPLKRLLVDYGVLGRLDTALLPTSAETLEVWLHVTNACNLDCSYCYVRKSVEHMSESTGEQAIQAVFDSAVQHGYKRVKIKYAGGEPTLQFERVMRWHRLAQARSRQERIDLEAVMLTNATLLTPEMAQSLKALGIRVMVSIDGLAETHDAQRPTVGGRGSSSTVRQGIGLLLDAGLTPFATITVTHFSLPGLKALVEWLLDVNVPFTLNFERPVTPRGLRRAAHDNQDAIAALEAVFESIEAALPSYSLLEGLIDRANFAQAHTHTCGVGSSYVVIDHHGWVSQCQMHLHQPVGSLAGVDPVALIRDAVGGIHNLPAAEKEGCKTCEWRHWCAGGCPLQTYAAAGRYDVKSPYCDVYKAVYPRLLRLEGLRLLRYGQAEQFFAC